MLVRVLVEVDMFSVFPYYGLEKKKKTIFFDIKCHDSYLMKCLHNNITQNDTKLERRHNAQQNMKQTQNHAIVATINNESTTTEPPA